MHQPNADSEAFQLVDGGVHRLTLLLSSWSSVSAWSEYGYWDILGTIRSMCISQTRDLCSK